jgi:hypothetical protein
MFVSAVNTVATVKLLRYFGPYVIILMTVCVYYFKISVYS